jgi:hypothetical protein
MTVDRRYSLALRGLPVLPADEQQRIARRYARTRDPADARRLVEGNLRLVVTIAQQMGGARRADLMDLVQEGNAGLMQAVERFDPARGVKLATYAGWWIRCFIMRHLMESSRIVRFASTREGRRRFFARALPPPDVPLDAAVGSGGGARGPQRPPDRRALRRAGRLPPRRARRGARAHRPGHGRTVRARRHAGR